MENRPDISVVVPVYNGAETLAALFCRTAAVMETASLQFEVLFVDDGSRDQSWPTIQHLKKVHGCRIKGFKLARNSGQQAATLCGLQHARGKWVITMDDDLQTPPEEIPKLLEAAKDEETDIAYGVYPSPKHGFLHNWGTRIFRSIFKRVAPHYPDGSSFRLIRGSILGFIPDTVGPWVFIDPLLSSLTGNITRVKVRHDKKPNGRSRYSFFKLIGLATTLLIIYSTLPLRLMIWCGLLAAVVSFGLGIYFLLQKLIVGSAIGFSSLMVTMTFTGGIMLLCLGILGEYISRIYTMGSGRRAFIIKASV